MLPPMRAPPRRSTAPKRHIQKWPSAPAAAALPAPACSRPTPPPRRAPPRRSTPPQRQLQKWPAAPAPGGSPSSRPSTLHPPRPTPRPPPAPAPPGPPLEPEGVSPQQRPKAPQRRPETPQRKPQRARPASPPQQRQGRPRIHRASPVPWRKSTPKQHGPPAASLPTAALAAPQRESAPPPTALLSPGCCTARAAICSAHRTSGTPTSPPLQQKAARAPETTRPSMRRIRPWRFAKVHPRSTKSRRMRGQPSRAWARRRMSSPRSGPWPQKPAAATGAPTKSLSWRPRPGQSRGRLCRPCLRLLHSCRAAETEPRHPRRRRRTQHRCTNSGWPPATVSPAPRPAPRLQGRSRTTKMRQPAAPETRTRSVAESPQEPGRP
mmetsp:Transcript_9339/g.32997  ORF Transcript_9339/g.32997 Transcript_9339/m.32997 type:complete len:379 (+) Transcript_9339:440-1576(+)